jgi:hypothetical protein
MPKFWSEVPAARMRELVADLSTVAWVSFWTVVAYRLLRKPHNEATRAE